MQPDVGMRVVRGPDWIWNDQDGEEGMLGTIIHREGASGTQGSVKVFWDHGGQGLYRCGEMNAYDLLAFSSTFGKCVNNYSGTGDLEGWIVKVIKLFEIFNRITECFSAADFQVTALSLIIQGKPSLTKVTAPFNGHLH